MGSDAKGRKGLAYAGDCLDADLSFETETGGLDPFRNPSRRAGISRGEPLRTDTLRVFCIEPERQVSFEKNVLSSRN
jgi:hypothetical protein